MTAAELPPVDTQAARDLTDRIKVGVEAVWHLITEAYTSRAWAALGYRNWDEYCTREFGTSRLRLPREERSEVVASLRESGLSIRAIAAATGLDKKTVNRDVIELSQKGTPETPSPTIPQGEPVSRAVGGGSTPMQTTQTSRPDFPAPLGPLASGAGSFTHSGHPHHLTKLGHMPSLVICPTGQRTRRPAPAPTRTGQTKPGGLEWTPKA